jgi:hypothetical protein
MMDVKQLLIVGAAILVAASSRSAFSHEVGGQYARVAQIEIDPAQLENYRAQPQLIALLLVPNCGFDRTSEVVWVVHNRREKIGSRNHAGAVVELPHRGVVGHLGPDQQLAVRRCERLIGQKLLQQRRRKLASAPTAMGKACQSHHWDIHIGLPTRKSVGGVDP